MVQDLDTEVEMVSRTSVVAIRMVEEIAIPPMARPGVAGRKGLHLVAVPVPVVAIIVESLVTSLGSVPTSASPGPEALLVVDAGVVVEERVATPVGRRGTYLGIALRVEEEGMVVVGVEATEVVVEGMEVVVAGMVEEVMEVAAMTILVVVMAGVGVMVVGLMVEEVTTTVEIID
eukprot:TRINITY_DN471_c0_g1_i1.p2 TRINITY_DN471_c0_g1~~TRINITY_DN471_c0_g1_i1.p2  ORF type:complete len:175 (-),score=53.61 TRINITY_DN471_c0_g1_i1:369-893(-)